jgi:sugar lactone lactonase YvrE
MNEKDPSGALYSLSPDGSLQTLKSGVRISNGLAWSPDFKTLYYIDTPTREIAAYDYDPDSGKIANPRVVVSVPKEHGWPDGMTSDMDGRLWVAMWGGAAITVWDAEKGQLLEKITFPAKNVTSCAFGGPQQDTLYVTSARIGLDEADLTAFPASGGLFRVATNLRGMPTFVFGD